MPEESTPSLDIPRIAPTERLVGLASLPLKDARSGASTRLATALRLGWRDGRLLVRFDCRHRGIVATLRADNAPLWTEDVVEAFLAFEDPPNRYLELEVNPLGARFSAIVDSPNLSRAGMSVRTLAPPGFEARTRIRESRWSALLSIPVERHVELRANFFRIDRTSGEFSALFPTMGDPPDFHRPASFGRFRLTA